MTSIAIDVVGQLVVQVFRNFFPALGYGCRRQLRTFRNIATLEVTLAASFHFQRRSTPRIHGQRDLALRSCERRFERRLRLISVVTLDARDRRLAIRAVHLRRVGFVIEGNLAVFCLAFFPEDKTFRDRFIAGLCRRSGGWLRSVRAIGGRVRRRCRLRRDLRRA